MTDEKLANVQMTRAGLRLIVKGLGVLEGQMERARSKEEVGSEIYEIRGRQIAEVRDLTAKLATKELAI